MLQPRKKKKKRSGAPVAWQEASERHTWSRPRPLSRHTLTAPLPWVLEFWLPGKISVLGERGLSFACSHPSRATRKKRGPLIHLSCVRGTPPLAIRPSPLPARSSRGRSKQASSSTFFYTSGAPSCFFFSFFSLLSNLLPPFPRIQQEVLKVLDAGASGMWALWEQHHPQTQTTAIDFSLNSTKKKTREEERNNSKLKKLVYWTIHFSSLWIRL